MNISDLQVKTTDLMGPRLQRLQSIAGGMLIVGLVLSAVGLILDQRGFFHSYLYAYMFWIGVTAGSLALLMLHHVVGGGWGFLIRRFLEAATRLLLPMLVLFVPVVIGLLFFGLYEWTHVEPGDQIIAEKRPYLNVPFFLGRTVLYFAIWMALAHFMNKWGSTQDERADPEVANRLNVVGAAGLVIYVLTVTFAAVDWVMSLTPHWYSSIFGLLVVVTQGLSTLALMLLLLGYLVGDEPLMGKVPSAYFRDLGNLTLAFVMLWAYMSFSQYLITYSGNLAEEVSWYTDRRRGGWGIISLALIPLHFFLPFLILLIGSDIKRSPIRLARVAAFLIVMRFIDLFWWVKPTFHDNLLSSLNPAVLGTPLLIGGIWLLLWAREVKDRYLVPLHDPRLEGALNGVAEHV